MNDGSLTSEVLDKKPILCNYLVLIHDNGVVTRYKTGKKYHTKKSLRWHLTLTGLPINSTVILDDAHYKQVSNLCDTDSISDGIVYSGDIVANIDSSA